MQRRRRLDRVATRPQTVGVEMRAATVALDDPGRSRTRTQIVWESAMANEQRLNELSSEVRELRRELELAKAELSKAIHWCATHWQECHERRTAEQEGH